MSQIKHISIKSVLYDLSKLIPSRYWNEIDFLEWAIKGARRINSDQLLEEAVDLLVVKDHQATLPEDTRFLIQCAAKTDLTAADVEEIQRLLLLDNSFWNISYDHMKYPQEFAQQIANAAQFREYWSPMRLSTNPFVKSLLCNPSLYPTQSLKYFNYPLDTNCPYEYTVNHDMTITTSFKDGVVFVSYMRWPQTECGEFLIPDDEDLKEAITHYCLYNYFQKKAIIQEPGADKQRDYHRRMWGLMKGKAAARINSPSVDQMENIKAQRNKLLPSTDDYSKFFSGMNQNEFLRRF